MVPEIWTLSRADFFVILDCFLQFYPLPDLTTQKNKKMKKLAGDIIISHMLTINNIHLMYVSWDIERVGQNFFVILDHFFAHLAPLTTQNIQILKKWTKCLEIAATLASYVLVLIFIIA